MDMAVPTPQTQPTPPTGRLKRLTNAALNADNAMMRVEGLATDASELIGGLSELVGDLDPAIENLDSMLVDVRLEFAAISRSRETADQLLARVGALIDLVEWMLTPAFVAKHSMDRMVVLATRIRRTLAVRLPGGAPRPRPAAPAVQLAPMPLAG